MSARNVAPVLGAERGNCSFLGLKLKTGLTLFRGADPTVPTASTSCALGAHGRTWAWTQTTLW
jgi:hypothetical protein